MTLKLNHLNLTVPDVAEAKCFFEKYFKFQCTDQKSNVLAILIGEDGFILALMSEAFNKQGSSSYPEAFHLGFILDSKEEVSSLYSKLKSGGLNVDREPARIRNSFGFYFYFGNLFIEVGYYSNVG